MQHFLCKFQVKSLRNKKTNTSAETGERYKVQNDRKADRFRKEIAILKKIKKKDAALFVLENLECWMPELPKNLTNYNDMNDDEKDNTENDKALEAALRKRVLIRLANHTEIKKVVCKFREDYPNWKEKLPVIIPVLGIKQRQKEEKSKSKRRQEERKRRKERTISSKISKNKSIDATKDPTAEGDDLNSADENEVVSENEENYSDEEESKDETDDTGVSNEDILEFDSKCNKNGNGSFASVTETGSNDVSLLKDTENNATLQTPDSSDQEPELILKFNKDSVPNFEKREGEMVIKRLNLNHPNMESFTTSDTEDQQRRETNEAQTTKNNVKDSFFLGGVSDSPSESDDENTHSMSTNNKDSSNRHQRRNDFFHGSKNSDKGIKGRESTFNNDIRGTGRGRRTSFNKATLADERGRKNSFRGRGRAENSYKNNYSQNTVKRKEFNGVSNVPTFIKSNNTTSNQDKSIHPSWAAKKKFANSANIVPMGKKIKFNDDGVEQIPVLQNQNKINKTPISSQINSIANKVPNLHPSWAAKNEQKGLKEFIGKKTVFKDDD